MGAVGGTSPSVKQSALPSTPPHLDGWPQRRHLLGVANPEGMVLDHAAAQAACHSHTQQVAHLCLQTQGQKEGQAGVLRGEQCGGVAGWLHPTAGLHYIVLAQLAATCSCNHLHVISPTVQRAPARRSATCAAPPRVCLPTNTASQCCALASNPPALRGTTRTASPRCQTQRAGWPGWSGRRGVPGPALQQKVERLVVGYVGWAEVFRQSSLCTGSQHPRPADTACYSSAAQIQPTQPCCTSSTVALPPSDRQGCGWPCPWAHKAQQGITPLCGQPLYFINLQAGTRTPAATLQPSPSDKNWCGCPRSEASSTSPSSWMRMPWCSVRRPGMGVTLT